VILAAETSAQEAATAQDSTTILFKDADDRAAPAKREAHERVSRVEAENATVLASACEDAEGLAQKVALLEGELAEARQDWEVAEENSRFLWDAAAEAERRWEESERECQEQFEELTLL
jgi:hypothetical protein